MRYFKLFCIHSLKGGVTLTLHLNFKWSVKLLEENIGRTLFDINHSKIFFTHLLE